MNFCNKLIDCFVNVIDSELGLRTINEEAKRFLNKYKEEYISLDLLLLNANIRPQKKAKLTHEG
ncbi:MAG: hypothetical protein ACRC6T_13910 [Sarcina sp.]